MRRQGPITFIGKVAADEIMGIRFLCPECGHKLNVKAFLAGKRGVCPQCTSGLDIPLESQITKGSAGSGGGFGSADSGDDPPETTLPLSYPPSPSGFPVAPVAKTPMSGPAATPATVPVHPVSRPTSGTPLSDRGAQAGPSGYPAARTVPMQPAVPARQATPLPSVTPMHQAVPMQPTVPMHPAASVQPMGPTMGPTMAPLMVPTAPLDPIDEAPQAIWYVRPPSGGQYGPARGDIMRKWLGEGRVSPDSLVWREGWNDWRTAAEAFPSLGAMVTPPMPVPVTPASYVASGTPAYSAGPIRPKRRNSTAMAVTIVVVLGLLCLALFVTLIVVLL
jgi:hypothetical protein